MSSSFDPARGPALPTAPAAPAAAESDESDHDDGPFIGWFDSSHDLLNGLAVTEHGALDDLAFGEAASAATEASGRD